MRLLIFACLLTALLGELGVLPLKQGAAMIFLLLAVATLAIDYRGRV
jgi:hypothetical protein